MEANRRILVVGKFYSEGFALHIAETLVSMGHTVRRFEPGFRAGGIGGRIGHRLNQVRGVVYSATDSVPAVRAQRMRALWQVSDEGPLDVVIVCHDFLWPAEVAELKRRTGAQVAMWFPDSLVSFGRAYFMNAPYDHVFFKDPYIVQVLGGVLKSAVHYLPECINPVMHCLPESDAGQGSIYHCDITTAGNQHSWRVAFFKNISEFDVKLWGNPASLWMAAGPVASMHQGRGVYNHDKVRAFRGAKIVINNLLYSEIWGVNARCFEAAGAGAFQLVDWRPGLDQLFEDGKELVSFKSVVDLKQKIAYWLPRESERRAIAKAGMRRALADHTYAQRLAMLLETVGGNQKGYPIPRIRVVVEAAE